MKKVFYEEPALEFISVELDDIITTSSVILPSHPFGSKSTDKDGYDVF